MSMKTQSVLAAMIAGVVCTGMTVTVYGREMCEKHECSDEIEQVVSLDQIPAAAQESMTKLAEGAKIEKVKKVSDDGRVTYEGSWQVNGQTHEAELTDEGALMESEITMNADEVPASVKAAAEKHLGDVKNLVFEEKTIIVYSVKVKSDAKGDQEGEKIMVTPDGRVREGHHDEEMEEHDHDRDHHEHGHHDQKDHEDDDR